MQTITAEIETSDGRIYPLSSAKAATAGVYGFTIRWGTSDPTQQPDPAVLSMQILDRDGSLAGDPSALNDAQIVIVKSAAPLWQDINDTTAYATARGTWAQADNTLTMAQTDGTQPPDPLAPVDYKGVITAGGTVTRHGDAWLISITASSRMLLLKRSQDQGPTSTDPRYAGLHWVTTPVARIGEIANRCQANGYPRPDQPIDMPSHVRAYDQQDTVSLLDLLTRTTPTPALWYDVYMMSDARSRLMQLRPAHPATVTMSQTTGIIKATDDDTTLTAIDPGLIRDGDSLAIPSPRRGLTINSYQTAAQSDGSVQYQADTVQLTATGLDSPQSTNLTWQTDAITQDQTGGTTWQPSQTDRANVTAWCTAIDTRLTPSITLDSQDIDPLDRPELFAPAPPGALVITGSRYHALHAADGTPAVDGTWLVIGGTLTYDARDGQPHMTHQLDIMPIATTPGTLTWTTIRPWARTWDQAGTLTWATLGTISKLTA